MKLIIGNRESGTGNWFVPYLSKRLGYFKIVDREQGIGGTGKYVFVPYSDM